MILSVALSGGYCIGRALLGVTGRSLKYVVSRLRDHIALLFALAGYRYAETERGAGAGFAPRPYLATVRLYKAARNGQAKAGAAVAA